MALTEYARIVLKSSSGVPTIPPSSSHDNGDWIATDIYEFEIYFDADTGNMYTRIGGDIIALSPPPVVHDNTLLGDGVYGDPLIVAPMNTSVSAYTLAVNAGDNTKFDFVVSGTFRNPATGDTTKVTNLTFTAQTVTPNALGVTYFGVKSDSTLTQQSTRFTTEQRHNHLCEWAVVYVIATNVIITFNAFPSTSNQLGQQFASAMANRGVINYGNNQYINFGGTTPLNIYKPVGGMVEGVGWGDLASDNPNEKIMAAISIADTFQIRKSTGLHLDAQTVIDPTIYESSAGMVTTLANNTDVVVYEISFFNSNLTRIQLGQQVFANIDDAEAYVLSRTVAQRLPFGQEANIAANGVLTTFLAVQKNLTSWSQTTRYRFFANPLTSRSGGGSSVTFNTIYDAVTAPQQHVTDAKGEMQYNSERALSTSKIMSWLFGGVEKAYVTGEGKFFGNVTQASNLVVKQNLTSSHTGTTSPFILATDFIRGNTFQANDLVKLYALFITTNSANTKTFQIYINDTPDLAGSPVLIATRTGTTSENLNCNRNLIFKGSISSQEIISPSTNVATDEAAGTTTYSTLTIDFSADKYLVTVGTNSLSSETVGLRFLRTIIYRN